MAGFFEERVGGVTGNDHVGPRVNANSRHYYDVGPCGTAVKVDANVLQGVADTPNDKVAPEGASQAYPRARAVFIVKVLQALEVPFAMVQIDSQGQLAIQEPRLDE